MDKRDNRLKMKKITKAVKLANKAMKSVGLDPYKKNETKEDIAKWQEFYNRSKSNI